MATEYQGQDAQGASDQSQSPGVSTGYNSATGQGKDWKQDQTPGSDNLDEKNSSKHNWTPGSDDTTDIEKTYTGKTDSAHQPVGAERQNEKSGETSSRPSPENRASEDDELAEEMPEDYRREDFIEENELEQTDMDYRDGDNQSAEDQDDEDALRNGK